MSGQEHPNVPALPLHANDPSAAAVPSGGATNTPQIEMVRLDALRPYEHNPQIHNRRQTSALLRSVRHFGIQRPILIGPENVIICGHAVVEAAKLAGYDEIPAMRAHNLSPAQIRAYRLADNKLAELATTDPARVIAEFNFLASVNYDLEETGYPAAEIDHTYALVEDGEDEDEDDALPLRDSDQAAVTRPGDLWLLDRHRLFCGNALDRAAIDSLMRGESAQMVFTDPPYGIPINGFVSGLGATRHREFVMGSSGMSSEELMVFLERVFANIVAVSADGAIHFACMDWRHHGEMHLAGRKAYSTLLNICVWAKTNAGMGSLYRSGHELVFVFKAGTGPHINNVELGRHGRHRTNVWRYPGANALTRNGQARLAMHPTVKPVAMVADAMRDCSKRGGIVLDPFVGSGTVFIAAERTGRLGYGMELDPLYVDVAVQRWESVTGGTARHAESGASFAELRGARAIDSGS